MFSYDRKDYLITVDYMSGYPELLQLKTTSSNTVVTAMKSVFARYGVLDVLMSDNGPQYSAKEFADFAKDWEFEHVT